ncbi:hypothetical protein B0H13DRAFT_2316070 [Mycena leptocephala]|nr:hypothetical protein B0H13DRAFT_2316070 [Mycena leptocephala]
MPPKSYLTYIWSAICCMIGAVSHLFLGEVPGACRFFRYLDSHTPDTSPGPPEDNIQSPYNPILSEPAFSDLFLLRQHCELFNLTAIGGPQSNCPVPWPNRFAPAVQDFLNGT